MSNRLGVDRFVKWLDESSQFEYGVSEEVVVREEELDRVYVKHLRTGYRFRDTVSAQQKPEECSKEEALDHFQNLSRNFRAESRNYSLLAAVSLCRQYNLDAVIDQFENLPTSQAIGFEPAGSGTGVYVVQGESPYNWIEAIQVEPRLFCQELSRVLYQNNRSFGQIPDLGTRGPTNVYEIPEKALHLVEDPIKLKFITPKTLEVIAEEN